MQRGTLILAVGEDDDGRPDAFGVVVAIRKRLWYPIELPDDLSARSGGKGDADPSGQPSRGLRHQPMIPHSTDIHGPFQRIRHTEPPDVLGVLCRAAPGNIRF